MNGKIKKQDNVRYIITMIFVMLAVLLMPLFSLMAFSIQPLYRLYDYQFNIENDCLVWNSSEIHGEDLSYCVYVLDKETSIELLKNDLIVCCCLRPHYTHLVSSNIKQRIALARLDLTSGYNTIMIISTSFSGGTRCYFLCSYTDWIYSVGLWHIYVYEDGAIRVLYDKN